MLKTISWQCQLVKLVKLERPFVSSAWSLRKHGTRSLLLLGLTDRHNILHICGQLPTAKNGQVAMSTGQTGIKLERLERPSVSSAWSLRKHGTRSLLRCHLRGHDALSRRSKLAASQCIRFLSQGFRWRSRMLPSVTSAVWLRPKSCQADPPD